MKIYMASLWQETNTFCPNSTELDLFESGYHLQGHEITARLADTNTEIGGFLNCLGNDRSIEVLPGTAAWATPSGKISNTAFSTIFNEFIDKLKAHLPVDGILLALHGSLVSEHIEDCEGYILEQVRKLAGSDVPVVASLDYHACVTRQMVANANLLVGYRTYPHVDYFDTGFRAASGLLRLLKNRGRLNKEFIKLPLMLPAENTETDAGPMAAAINRLRLLDKTPGIISSSVFCTQPWLDVFEHGATVLVYSAEDVDATIPAKDIADYIWENRQKFFLTFPDIRTYLDSIDQYAKPAIVVDSGDITSAGALGDSTEILRALLERESRLKTVITMVDPTAVEQAVRLGEGGCGKFSLGGSQDYGYNARTQVTARVAKISDAKVKVKGPSFAGMELDMGRRALLNIGGTINLIVSERTSLLHDPEILRSIGINPEDFDLIIQKSHKLFRAAYQHIAKSVTILDTPGFSNMNLKRLPFKKVKRPIYPLDEL